MISQFNKLDQIWTQMVQCQNYIIMITINATAITNITSRKCFLCRKRLLNSKDNEWLQAFWAFKKAGDVGEDPKGTYAWFEWEGASSKLATNAGGRQSSAIARAMNFPKNFGLKQTKLTLVTLG